MVQMISREIISCGMGHPMWFDGLNKFSLVLNPNHLSRGRDILYILLNF